MEVELAGTESEKQSRGVLIGLLDRGDWSTAAEVVLASNG
jgi:hypothetical protein